MTPQTTQTESNGKPRCRLNAFRHGLAGHIHVLTEAEAPRFHKHATAIRDHYRPVGPIETSLVDQIANGIWRLQRVEAIEEGLYALDSAPDPEPGATVTDPLLGPTGTWLSHQTAFDLLGRCQGRIRRSLDRDKAELAALQSERKHQTAMDMDRAVALHRLAKSEGKSYDPSLFRPPHLTSESVFSPEVVAAEADRREAEFQLRQRTMQMQKQPKAA